MSVMYHSGQRVIFNETGEKVTVIGAGFQYNEDARKEGLETRAQEAHSIEFEDGRKKYCLEDDLRPIRGKWVFIEEE